MQNFSEAQHLAPIRDEGKVRSATGNGKIPFVAAEDIARVAKHLLVDDKPHNTDYVVLGPELLSYDDVSSIFVSFVCYGPKTSIRFDIVSLRNLY